MDETNKIFAINVYDESVNPAGNFVERWVVSSDPAKLDGFRRSQYIEDVVNGKSVYIRVIAKSDLATDAMPVTLLSAESLATGDGTAKSFSKALANKPIQPQSLAVKAADNVISGENIGTGDGTLTTFAATLSRAPIKSDSVSVTAGSITLNGNSSGVISGTGGSGTVNHDSGAITITFDSAPASSTDVEVDYNRNYHSER